MPPDNDNPAALAKLLSDALGQVDDLRRQLAEAERRASKAERLLVQLCPPAPPATVTTSPPKDPLVLLSEADDRAAAAERVAALADARLRDAADAWASLERAMAATRAELARVLPAPPSPAPHGAPPPLRTLSRVPTQIVTLPASPLTTGRPSFPSLPPPPLPNPRNQQPMPLAAQRSAPPMPTSSTSSAAAAAAAAAAMPPSKKPRMEPSLPPAKKPREERARFSESPPPPPQQQRLQPPPSAETAPGAAGHRRDGSKGSISAFSSGSLSDEGRNKRKRGEEEEEDDELMNDDDDGSRSDMSLDEMILAVSGAQPSSHAGPQSSGHSHHASSASTSSTSTLLANPNSGNHIQHGGRRKVPVSAAHVAPLYPALNAQGHRQCRQCGQAGRYKDGKCVEKWGPGPAGPGTVCDRCRKKMKRVERRGYELVRDGPGSGSLASISMASTPSQSFAQSQSQSFSQSSQSQSQPQLSQPQSQPPSSQGSQPLGPAPAQSQSFSHPAQSPQLRVHSPPQRTSTSPVLPTSSTFLAAAAITKEPSSFGSSSTVVHEFAPAMKESPKFGASSFAAVKEVSSFGSSRRASPAPAHVPIPRGGDTLVDIPATLRGFNYEPPTSSVRSGWMKSEEVEPVS